MVGFYNEEMIIPMPGINYEKIETARKAQKEKLNKSIINCWHMKGQFS
jgi:hypothetical protein